MERLLSILADRYGVERQSQTGGFHRVTESLGALGRFDYTPSSEHSFSLRAFGSGYWQTNALVLNLDLLSSGGRIRNTAAGVALNGTSRFGQDWVNEFRVGYNGTARRLSPLSSTPEARVQIDSDLPEGRNGIAVVAFGGDPQTPTSGDDQLFEFANELSRRVRETHRIKLGGLLTYGRSRYENSSLGLGSFTFNSLADLERGTPASFSRRLTSQTATGSVWMPRLCR
jgi:hypothetical protein